MKFALKFIPLGGRCGAVRAPRIGQFDEPGFGTEDDSRVWVDDVAVEFVHVQFDDLALLTCHV
eukprot:CAMPEP_0185587220 /NCGR_PEP_ID=MMETSP0434-20130131/48010_1 /TAXON_ID=626734 ORGANISM="Favella taraikaensis, Strain Fe Narragansett Bay" /NCGR_SAMPLE_ID=MMETSP0434 /ASSEMBLY_ACC=CAM_ASM_000379 /LENGTH=62 /DNA_ID=CAMNT_0028208925 /DNA_START=307 /DNA_END=492 /DNA_ORIENTATION=-